VICRLKVDNQYVPVEPRTIEYLIVREENHMLVMPFQFVEQRKLLADITVIFTTTKMCYDTKEAATI